MLHELLLALSGHIGGLFLETDGKIKVAKVSFLHPGEEALLNRLCEHGTYFRQIQLFITKFIDFKSDADIAPGVYMNALCYSLQDDILSQYEDCLLELEEEIMLDADIPLSYIQNKLVDYTLLFPSLVHVLQDVEKKKVRGCQLLSLMNRHSASGIPCVKVAIKRLLRRLHEVMFKQLSPWLLFGMLSDRYGEFFIHKARKTKALASPPATDQEDELGIGGLSGEQLRDVQASLSSTVPLPQSDIYDQFSLRVDMLPTHIPSRLFYKILFIGESVDMFENNEKLDKKKSILKDRTTEFSKELYKLSQSAEFQPVEFERTIDTIRSCVTERFYQLQLNQTFSRYTESGCLWEYVVSESNLKSSLLIVKNVYLLGRGDLFQTLIESADTLLSCPPGGSTANDVNRVFQQVLRSLDINDDGYQLFQLNVETSPKNSSGATKTRKNGWNTLTVNYRAKWPLHVFFTPLAIERLNMIFCFLLAVKRAHLALHASWKQLMAGRSSRLSDDSFLLLQQLRNHMQFLIDNLQTYLHVDVIESQFKELLDKIDETKDFEVIRSTHETFLTSVLSQCFLLNVPVNHCLNCILESCSAFCALLSTCDADVTVDQLEHFQALQTMFQKQTLLLFKILTNSKTHQRNPYLVQLLLRIDYNKYFSSAGQQLG